MPSRPINLDPNYSFPGQRRGSVAPMPQAAPAPSPGGSPVPGMGGGSAPGVDLVSRLLAQPKTVAGDAKQTGVDSAVTSALRGDTVSQGVQNVLGSVLGGLGDRLTGMSPALQTGIGSNVAGIVNTAIGSKLAGAADTIAQSQNKDYAAQANTQIGSTPPASSGPSGPSNTDLGGLYSAAGNFGQAAGDYQGNLANIALERALAGDTRDYSKEGYQLDANQQRELLQLKMAQSARDLGLLDQERNLTNNNKGFAGRELDLNKALRQIQHEGVGLDRKDIDLSDRNIELDRTDIKTKYGADVRHANQAATAGGSWFAPEHGATLTDLYSGLLTNAGRLDTRWQHNNLERGRADLSDRTIDNNAGRDQLGYDRSLNSIDLALLGIEGRRNNVNDASQSTGIQLKYLDPILAHKMAGADLSYRGNLIPTYKEEQAANSAYNRAYIDYISWMLANGIKPGGDQTWAGNTASNTAAHQGRGGSW